MGGRRPAPRVINTPTGPRRASDERDRDERRPVGDVGRPVFRGPKDRRPPGPRIPAPDTRRPRTEEKFGDSFRESRRERRRMAGDRKGFFGRVQKRPAPDTRDRKPIENFTGTMGMADGSPESRRKRKEAFEKKVNNLSPERRKEFDENRLRFKFTEEESGRPRLKRTYQDQNIARTDI